MSQGPFRRAAAQPVPWLVVLLLGMVGFALLLGVCVQEDAFISFRYARNLVRGNGLVYNVGEPVEGYTNFLWTVMIAGGMALGADPATLSRYLGLACAVALVLLVWAVARRRDGPRLLTGGLVAAGVLAMSPQLAAEAVEGLETVFFALLVTAGVLLQVAGRDREAARRQGAVGRLLAGAAVLALAALTRPEGIGVLGLSTLAGIWWRRRRGLPALTRAELGAVAVFLLLYVPYWLWRFDYYGYPLPNTFYAKTGGGLRHLVRGLGYLGRFLLLHPGLTLVTLAALAAALPGLAGLRSRRAAARTAPKARGGAPATGAAGGGPAAAASGLVTTAVVVAAGYLAYVAAVGGDFKRTFRFVLPVLPLWALALDAGLGRLAAAWPRRRAGGPGRGAAVLWVVLALLAADAVIGSPGTGRWARARSWDLVRRTALGRHLAAVAEPDAVLAIHSAGIVPYVSDLYTIDMWGLSDLHIAHRHMPDMGGSRPTGHEKRDPAYVFARLPDYYVDEWFCVRSEPVPGLAVHAFGEPPRPPEGAFYRVVSAPVELNDGSGPRRYWLNYLQLDRAAAAAAGLEPAGGAAGAGSGGR